LPKMISVGFLKTKFCIQFPPVLVIVPVTSRYRSGLATRQGLVRSVEAGVVRALIQDSPTYRLSCSAGVASTPASWEPIVVIVARCGVVGSTSNVEHEQRGDRAQAPTAAGNEAERRADAGRPPPSKKQKRS